jgi:hypothetical protein
MTFKRFCCRSGRAKPGGLSISVLLFSVMGSCFLNGCISRPTLAKQLFAFAAPAGETPLGSTTGVLGVRTLTISPLFEGRSLVYRTGEHSYEQDPYAEFLVPPALALLPPLRAAFRTAGVFGDVAEAGSALKPDILAEIYVSELYGDFRRVNDPSAVLTMRFLFFEAPNGIGGKLVLQKDCSRRIRLHARTAVALLEGWDQGLEQILAEISAGLKAARK